MLRQGNITPVEPLQVFDVSEIKNAFRQFSKASRIGKIAVSMMDPTSEVEVTSSQRHCAFWMLTDQPGRAREIRYPLQPL